MWVCHCGKEQGDAVLTCPVCGSVRPRRRVEKRWHYILNDAPAPAVDEAGLEAAIREGKITPDTPVWVKGMPDWAPAGQTELAACFADPEQPPQYARPAITVTPIAPAAPVTVTPPAAAPAKPEAGRTESDPEARWYVMVRGTDRGPYSQARMEQYAREGRMPPDAQLWKEGLLRYLPAAETEFRGLLPLPAAGLPEQPAAPREEPLWHYADAGGRDNGPLTAAEMGEKIVSGTVSADTRVWNPALHEWLPAEQTAFRSLFPARPEGSTRNALPDIYAWLLAVCAPMVAIAIIIISMLAGHIYNRLAQFIVCFLLNTVWLVLDYLQVEKYTQNSAPWCWTGLVLTPLYLFLRAAKTNKMYGCAAVNSLLFVISILLSIP